MGRQDLTKKHIRERRPLETEKAPTPNTETSKRGRELTREMDELIDEIDEVLEENAEEFVKGFIQRGGE